MEKNKIFISHRHSDTQSDCHRLKSDLQEHFGRENVFLDIENLEPGINFSDAIEKALAMSKVVLVVIGPDWQGPEDSQGVKRLFQPNDWVRREVAAALKSNGTRVIPVLMKKASEPQESNLPEDLKPLASLQATEITIKRWDYDVGELMKVIERIVPKEKKQEQKPAPSPPPRPYPNTYPSNTQQKSWWAKNYLWALGALVGFLILIGMCVPETEIINPEPYPIVQQDNPKSRLLPDTTQPKTTEPAVNPSGQNPVEEPSDFIPTLSGKWWLKENGVRMGYFIISQEGSDFTFDYYYFDQLSGKGYGSFVADQNAVFSEEFTLNDTRDPAGFAFQSNDNWNSWIGLVQKYGIENNATLSREY